MTGLIYAVAPLAAACLIARREPAHRPVALALGASALYSVAALPAVASHLDGRVLLGLFALVAVASGRAYARAFGWQWTEPNVTRLGWALIGAVGALALVSPRASVWEVATWGPFIASSVVGAGAVWAWWRTREREPARNHESGTWHMVSRGPLTITQRCTLVLLASDVCMLAFVRWPGVQAWQGRVAALAVTVVQGAWLWQTRSRTTI